MSGTGTRPAETPDGEGGSATLLGDDGEVTLRFSFMPVGGRTAELVFASATPEDLDCEIGCRVEYSVDGGALVEVSTSLPPADVPTLSMRMPEDLFPALVGADTAVFTYADGDGSIAFTVTGLEPGRVPSFD